MIACCVFLVLEILEKAMEEMEIVIDEAIVEEAPNDAEVDDEDDNDCAIDISDVGCDA